MKWMVKTVQNVRNLILTTHTQHQCHSILSVLTELGASPFNDFHCATWNESIKGGCSAIMSQWNGLCYMAPRHVMELKSSRLNSFQGFTISSPPWHNHVIFFQLLQVLTWGGGVLRASGTPPIPIVIFPTSFQQWCSSWLVTITSWRKVQLHVLGLRQMSYIQQLNESG